MSSAAEQTRFVRSGIGGDSIARREPSEARAAGRPPMESRRSQQAQRRCCPRRTLSSKRPATTQRPPRSGHVATCGAKEWPNSHATAAFTRLLGVSGLRLPWNVAESRRDGASARPAQELADRCSTALLHLELDLATASGRSVVRASGVGGSDRLDPRVMPSTADDTLLSFLARQEMRFTGMARTRLANARLDGSRIVTN